MASIMEYNKHDTGNTGFFLGFITRSVLCLDNWFSLTTMVFLSEQGIHFLKV